MDKIQNSLNITFDEKDFCSDSYNPDIINHISKYTLKETCENNFISTFDLRNDEDSNLNPNYYSPSTSFLIKNIDNKELEKIEKPTNLGTNAEKYYKNEESQEFNNQKENKKNFLFKAIDNQKNSLNNKKKLIGRKKKSENNNNTGVVHSKYYDDNLRRKVKYLVLNSIREFINSLLKKIYNNNIGNNIFKKQLLKINKAQTSNATIEFNKEFLNKNLGDIFSEPISTKFTNYLQTHNETLIKSLRNEKDQEKNLFFNKLFNLTFLQCLKHFRGTETLDILNGITCFDKIKENLLDETDYADILEYYINDFENILMRKKSRKSRIKKGKLKDFKRI